MRGVWNVPPFFGDDWRREVERGSRAADLDRKYRPDRRRGRRR